MPLDTHRRTSTCTRQRGLSRSGKRRAYADLGSFQTRGLRTVRASPKTLRRDWQRQGSSKTRRGGSAKSHALRHECHGIGQSGQGGNPNVGPHSAGSQNIAHPTCRTGGRSCRRRTALARQKTSLCSRTAKPPCQQAPLLGSLRSRDLRLARLSLARRQAWMSPRMSGRRPAWPLPTLQIGRSRIFRRMQTMVARACSLGAS
mmetsp:Transcript_26686/g.62289  ORF Transcript_26686/g.62289 Transcript_26686/m.62289 type:complete len:202 (-) Transcript_26686:1232-1837(-)